MKHKLTLLGFFIILFIIGCGQDSTQEKGPSEITGAVIGSDAVEKEETKQDANVKKQEEVEQEADPVKELLELGKSVKSISYNYKGPETGNFYYEFYVKGDNARYIPDRGIKSLDEKNSYNAIYLDKSESTAMSYCDDRKCVYKGKKADLRYVDYNILTPFEWLDIMTSAEKVSEEVLGTRNTWKLKANNGITAWVDVYYGIPLQITQNGKKYEFIKMVFNSLKDSDIVPG